MAKAARAASRVVGATATAEPSDPYKSRLRTGSDGSFESGDTTAIPAAPWPFGWGEHPRPGGHPHHQRRPAGRHGTPYRAAQRAAHPHRGDPGDAQRLVRRLGRRRLPGRDRPAVRRLALPGAPALQGHPASAARWTSPRRSRRWAARPTPSPPRSTPATTRGCSTRTCRWPIDVMCDLVADSVLDPADVETERGVILEEIAMHDDEPGDEVHDLFAGPSTATHPLGRLISGTEETITPMTRAADPRLLPPPLHRAVDRHRGRRQPRPRRRWSAASARRCAGSPLDTAPAQPASHRPAGPRGTHPQGEHGGRAEGDRAGARRARLPRHRPPRRAALRPRRAEQRARRRHVQPAVPGDPGAARPGLLGLLLRQPVRRQRALRRLRRLRAGQGATRCWT